MTVYMCLYVDLPADVCYRTIWMSSSSRQKSPGPRASPSLDIVSL